MNINVHYLRSGTDTAAACGQSVFTAPPADAFCTRHDQATCPGCKASSL